MSVLVAVKHNNLEEKGVIIASDTQMLSGYEKINCGPKWIACATSKDATPTWWLGCSGNMRGLDLIRQNHREIAAVTDANDIGALLRRAIDADKWKPVENPGDSLSWDCEFIATNGAAIYTFGRSITLCAHYDPFACIGSGSEIATGYWAACQAKVPVSLAAHTLAREMVDCAIRFGRYCGGTAWWNHVPEPAF